MAKITLGIGTSHTPMLNAPVTDWPKFIELDRHRVHQDKEGNTLNYEQLLALADDQIPREITEEKFLWKHTKALAALEHLHQVVKKAEIDILVFSSKEELMRHPFVKSKIHSKTIRSVSKQNENNMADDILRKNGRNMPQGHEAQIIRCDGPNIKFNQSYIDLKSTHPDYDQKFLFAFKTGNVKRNFNDKTFLGKK
jgi:hypothetical protein